MNQFKNSWAYCLYTKFHQHIVKGYQPHAVRGVAKVQILGGGGVEIVLPTDVVMVTDMWEGSKGVFVNVMIFK